MFHEICKAVRTKMPILLKLVCVLVIVPQGVGSQNSINPRRSKANLTDGVPSCPNLLRHPHSTCKMSCLSDEDCENHDDHLKCCPTSPGSRCKAECRQAVFSPHGATICYDFEKGAKYVIGDVFQRDGTCCQCRTGGVVNCSLAKACTHGCYYNSKYYKEGITFSPSKCQNCSCRKSQVYCKYDTNCTREKCPYKGKIYKTNHILRLDNGCKECVCENQGWKCNAITCDAQRSLQSSVSPQRFETALILLQVMLSVVFLVS